MPNFQEKTEYGHGAKLTQVADEAAHLIWRDKQLGIDTLLGLAERTETAVREGKLPLETLGRMAQIIEDARVRGVLPIGVSYWAAAHLREEEMG